MITVPLASAPPYIALSYAWGSTERVDTVRVNGYKLPITQSLSEALRAIFQYARDRELLFWADSLCIDQNDVAERGHQVQLMHDIYNHAQLVAVWLGPGDEDSAFAVDTMAVWRERIDSEKLPNREALRTFVQGAPLSDKVLFGDREGRDAFRTIIRREWWSRAWIVQESTANSKEGTIFFCGSDVFDWDSLITGLHIVDKTINMDNAFNDAEGRARQLHNFHQDREGYLHVSFMAALAVIRTFNCRDPRDKVYSALGMAMDIVPGDFVPDYEKSTGEVYKDVARWCLTKAAEGHRLDFLGYVRRTYEGSHYVEPGDIPTWTPDWRVKIHLRPLEKYKDPYDKTSEKVYKASGDRRAQVRVAGGQLHVKGFVVDRITRVWMPCRKAFKVNPVPVRSWFPDNPDEKYFTGETMEEAFCRTITADNWRVNVDWDLLNSDRHDLTPEQREGQKMMKTDVAEATIGRRFFETANGYMGLALGAAAVGDDVCLFLGGSVLYVLRKKEDGPYEFMGECYTHGLMDGEALKEDSYTERNFVIV
jgi:Heterokaryon incompatibility protein (HET)